MRRDEAQLSTLKVGEGEAWKRLAMAMGKRRDAESNLDLDPGGDTALEQLRVALIECGNAKAALRALGVDPATGGELAPRADYA
jgi:hypothetical protein